MKIVEKTYIIKFVDSRTGDLIQRSINDVDSLTEAYSEIRDNICSQKNISIGEFESTYDVKKKRTTVSYCNTPWNNFNELEQNIQNLPAVNYARYVAPMTGPYGPPKFIVDSDNSTDLENQVNNYYEGLVVNKNRGRDEIIVSPSSYKDST